jgi:hypothetical protein
MSADDRHNLSGSQFRLHHENFGGGHWEDAEPNDEHPYAHKDYVEHAPADQSHMLWASTGNNRPLGHMTWDQGVINKVEVYDPAKWGNRGMATQMYQKAQEITPGLKHSDNRSEMGENWARKVGGKRPERMQDHPEWFE